MTEPTKWCPHCQAEKPLSEFYTNKAAASGVDGFCKEYRKERARARGRETRDAKRQKRIEEGDPPPPRYRTDLRIDDQGRQCGSCLTYKPWDDFYLDTKGRWGHSSECVECTRERQRERATTPEGREGTRQRMAAMRARRRAPDWEPSKVSRHSELDCDGTQHRCTGPCGQVKPVEEFPGNKNTPCGYDPRCQVCRHQRRQERRASNHNGILDKEKLNWSLTKYGITADDYIWLYEEQNGVCVLCLEPEAGETFSGSVRRMAVDHDWDCCGPGRACKKCIRGLLCFDCNTGIGKFDKKPATAVRFADYLALRPLAA